MTSISKQGKYNKKHNYDCVMCTFLTDEQQSICMMSWGVNICKFYQKGPVNSEIPRSIVLFQVLVDTDFSQF
jgi:hypothetical protein